MNNASESQCISENEKFSIIIDVNVINTCLDQVYTFLHGKKHFVEVGGYLIGTFHKVPQIKIFDIDYNAISSPVSINFSDNYYFEIENKLKTLNEKNNDKYYVLGTWHVHPASHGANYSSIDENYLFLERMLITTDEPHASHPVIHVIFNQDMRDLKIYTMAVLPEYVVEEKPFIAEELNTALDNKIIIGGDIGILLLNSRKQIEYYRAKEIDHQLIENDQIGFWKYFPLKVHNFYLFEQIYFENFYQKTRIDEFYFIKIQKIHSKINKRFFKVKRAFSEDNENITGFRSVPFIIFEEPKEIPKTIVLQNPDTKEIVSIEFDFNLTVEELKSIMKKKHNIKGEIVCFTYFNRKGKKKYQDFIKGDDSRVLLPDRISIKEIKKFTEENELPIYFFNNKVDDKKLFQFRTDRFSRAGYNIEKINCSHVFIGGIGLLGNEIAYNLATLGIGRLTLVDNGKVDWYNIYRQLLFTSPNQVYNSKVKIAKNELEKQGNIEIFSINIEVPCLGSTSGFNWFSHQIERLENIIIDADVVIGAFDTYSARAVLQVLSVINNKVFVSSAVDLNEGLIEICFPDSNYCYCCGKPDHGTFMDGGNCTLSTIESQKIISSLTTKIITEIITDEYDKDFNQIMYHRKSMEIEKCKIKGSKKCRICGTDSIKNTEFNDSDAKYQLLYNWLYN